MKVGEQSKFVSAPREKPIIVFSPQTNESYSITISNDLLSGGLFFSEKLNSCLEHQNFRKKPTIKRKKIFFSV